MITLGELCDLVAGRATLVVELKSRFDGDLRLVRRAADVLARYAGPAAVMSFDPAPIAALRELSPALPRGIVAERRYRHHEWDRLPARSQARLAYFGHALRTRPQFVAYSVSDLPCGRPHHRTPALRPAVSDLDGAHRPPTAKEPRATPTR